MSIHSVSIDAVAAVSRRFASTLDRAGRVPVGRYNDLSCMLPGLPARS
jgi:hypothetical protein